ncbi:MAG: hypothetical protein GKR93_10770 [Gammaproteobacteria bacterium]|nr:hypothetical protein [Gammaproteobacteria bacterium]
MQIAKDDHYCYCSDMLVTVRPAAILEIIATGENHQRWASSRKREDSPGVWVGTSYFTGEESIRLGFDVDHENHFVDFLIAAPDADNDELQVMTWARVVPGERFGYDEGSSIVGLYQPRFADQSLEFFLRDRFLHASEMYRIKALAEQSAPVPADTLPGGEYLATASEVIPDSVDTVFDFISDGLEYGKWTWGRSERTGIDTQTFQCKQDFGGPDLLLRLELDRKRHTVDYYIGEKPDAMLLQQSARVFDASLFGYEQNHSLLTLTRWRAAGESSFEWDRAVLSQLVEMKMTTAVLARS